MLRGLLAFLCLSLASLHAAPIVANHPLEALAEADALVVGRVTRIEVRDEVQPRDGRQWQHPVFEHVAEVEPLRFYSAHRDIRQRLASAGSLRVGYRAENPLEQGGVFSGPLWPEIREGDVRIFALRRVEGGAFQLWFENGFGAVPPAHESLPQQAPITDGVSFLERELAAALASGHPSTAHAAARYAGQALITNYDSLAAPNPRQLGFMAQMLGDDLERTQEAAAALLASQGIPRPTVADFLAGRAVEGGVFTPMHRLTAWALNQLPEMDRERLLIETLLRNLPVYTWGAVMTLKEFAHHPELEAPLSGTIAARPAGVLPLLEALIRQGRSDLIPPALGIVREQIENATGSDIAWQSGARLLWDHGSPEDFERFFALIRNAQSSDPVLYRRLWSGAAHYDAAPRRPMLRFFALYLADSRNDIAGVRYSDVALGALAHLKGDLFGLESNKWFGEIPLAERNAAIQRASEWLTRQLQTEPRPQGRGPRL